MTEPGDGPRSDPDAPTAKLPAVPRDAAKRPPTAKPAAAPRERIRKPGPLLVIAGSFGLFFAITALLAFQMRRGADPALGAPKPQVVAAAATPAPRKILVRRVIVTRIVEHRARRDDGARTSAPAQSTTAPSAPTPAPAAPPAAPAPLTTRSS